MTITALLLLPVGAILVWGYARLRPRGPWRWPDTGVVAFNLVAASWAAHRALTADWGQAGPIWPSVAAALAAYLVLLLGLSVGLWLRHRSTRS